MHGTSHERVLASLSLRADRFRNRSIEDQENTPHSWSIQATRISKTSLIKYIDAEQQERNEVFNIELPEEVPQVHGHPPPPKKGQGHNQTHL